ncbi:MAG: hypothetical protein AAF244_00715 [Pseudomonadota bacterium]
MSGVLKRIISVFSGANLEREATEIHFALSEIQAVLSPILEPQDTAQGENPLITALNSVNDWLLASGYNDEHSDRFKRSLCKFRDQIGDALEKGSQFVTIQVSTLEGIAQTINVIDKAAEKIYYDHSRATEHVFDVHGLDISEAQDTPLITDEFVFFSKQASSKDSLDVREKLMAFSRKMHTFLNENGISFSSEPDQTRREDRIQPATVNTSWNFI